jgi:hypothetical protein
MQKGRELYQLWQACKLCHVPGLPMARGFGIPNLSRDDRLGLTWVRPKHRNYGLPVLVNDAVKTF